MPDITIIIPHKRTQDNNRAFEINIAMLQQNTVMDYELIVDTEVPKDPYKVWNEAAVSARSDWLVFSNSDVLMGPSWDVTMYRHCHYNNIVTGYLVEPGNIGVAAVNIHKDFGRTPYNFRRMEFENWADAFATSFKAMHGEYLTHKNGQSWYMPCMVNRDWFLSTGGFDTTQGFPNPNDILFWNKCEAEYGTEFKRVASIAYHFQNLSGRG